MELFLWCVGTFLIWVAIMRRINRRDEYNKKLAVAEDERRIGLLWGFGTADDDERIRKVKTEGYGSQWERFKFTASNWAIAIVGGVFYFLYTWGFHEIRRRTTLRPSSSWATAASISVTATTATRKTWTVD
jgi:hypothetical protein